MMNLNEETKRLKELTGKLNQLSDESIRREDLARILEFIIDLIPIIVRALRAR